MAKFNGITFNDVQIPDFVRVLGIEHSILPPVSQNLITVPSKHGAYDFGNEVGAREISINIAIILEEENTLPAKLEQLASWLYHEEAKKLVLGDDTGKYYLAKFTGDSNIQESFLVGEGSITFLCSNPFKHGEEKQVLIPSSYDGSEPINVVNTGTAVTHPHMKFEIAHDITSFSVVADEEYIELGTPFTVDEDKVISTHGKYALYDQLTTTNGWTNSASVVSGTVSGGFEVFGNHCFRQTQFAESATGWNGGAMQKPLDFAVQDFEAVFHFRFKSNKSSLGRLQMYLLNEAGQHLFMAQLYDGSPNDNTMFFSVRGYNNTEVVLTSKTFAAYRTGITGYISIKRVGTTYYFEVRENEAGTYKRLFYGKYVDKQKQFTAKVKQVKLHIGAFKTYTPSTMEHWDVIVSNLDKGSLNNSNTLPLIATAGDVLEIDNSTGAILKNGIPFYQYLNPFSSFIRLERGANGLQISPADAINNGVITYRELSL